MVNQLVCVIYASSLVEFIQVQVDQDAAFGLIRKSAGHRSGRTADWPRCCASYSMARRCGAFLDSMV